MPTRPARVGYLGPEGTFSEEALLSAAARNAVEPVAMSSILETVGALREGTLEFSLVPVENSLEGSINVTLDLLAEEEGGLQIVGETVLRVRHSLVACAPVELAEIETVLTHPQVPGQCRHFLRGELPHAQVLPASSTAEAVRLVLAEGVRTRAAIGTSLAAEIYGGTVLRAGVEDRDDNETRFVWLAREEGGTPPLRETSSRWKTSLVFWGPGAESPGWLVRCLEEFASRAINLTKIESRPRRRKLGSYMFFVDLAGPLRDPAVADALAGVRAVCGEVRVLGSYCAAGAAVDERQASAGQALSTTERHGPR